MLWGVLSVADQTFFRGGSSFKDFLAQSLDGSLRPPSLVSCQPPSQENVTKSLGCKIGRKLGVRPRTCVAVVFVSLPELMGQYKSKLWFATSGQEFPKSGKSWSSRSPGLFLGVFVFPKSLKSRNSGSEFFHGSGFQSPNRSLNLDISRGMPSRLNRAAEFSILAQCGYFEQQSHRLDGRPCSGGLV